MALHTGPRPVKPVMLFDTANAQMVACRGAGALVSCGPIIALPFLVPLWRG